VEKNNPIYQKELLGVMVGPWKVDGTDLSMLKK